MTFFGAPPVVSYTSVQKVAYGVDEVAVAGGLAGEPIRVVKCKTVDLVVPAEAEIVIEGHFNTEWTSTDVKYTFTPPFMSSRGDQHSVSRPRRVIPNPYLILV